MNNTIECGHDQYRIVQPVISFCHMHLITIEAVTWRCRLVRWCGNAIQYSLTLPEVHAARDSVQAMPCKDKAVPHTATTWGPGHGAQTESHWDPRILLGLERWQHYCHRAIVTGPSLGSKQAETAAKPGLTWQDETGARHRRCKNGSPRVCMEHGDNAQEAIVAAKIEAVLGRHGRSM